MKSSISRGNFQDNNNINRLIDLIKKYNNEMKK